MREKNKNENLNTSRQAEEAYLEKTLAIIRDNIKSYGHEITRMQEDIDEMLERYHDNDVEVFSILNTTMTLHEHMQRALARNEKARSKPYFGRIIFHDEMLDKEESLYIGRGGIAKDATHQVVVDWRAPAANAYYENGLGKCSYEAPGGEHIKIDLKHKRTYEIEEGRLLDYFDSEVIANDDLLTKYLAKNKQAVLGEIVATIQKEQNEIIRKSPYHNIIVQGVAGSGKTTVAMHRISYILYNYKARFRPDDFYIVGSNRILLNYITGVLPDLDVYGVRQMTMEQLFVRLLYEDWDEKRYEVKSLGKGGKKEIIKGSKEWFEALEKYCRQVEVEAISRDSVFLNKKQFVEGIRDGKTGVFDETKGEEPDPQSLVCLLDRETVENYIRENPAVSIQNKIDMLNKRLTGKIKDEFLKKGLQYTEAERKAILKAYRKRYGGRVWKRSIYEMYREFLTGQITKGYEVEVPENVFDVYDLAALAYLYKRVKEKEVIREAHHVVIDEAQDFGMMAYCALKFCMTGCTYTIMGDVSQNIHFGCGLNDWEELKSLLLTDTMDSFGILKKSYRNTVEISDFATNILRHGQFPIYPVEPIIRHGNPVRVQQLLNDEALVKAAADTCRSWQTKGFDTIAVVCRNQADAARIAAALKKYVEIMESDLEKAVFGNGIMVLPVDYTKGLEFDAVLILNPTKEAYPEDDGHAKLLYVAATRALHELCVLHTGNITGLMTKIPLPKRSERKMITALHGKEAEQKEKSAAGTEIQVKKDFSSEDASKKITIRKKPVAIAANRKTPEDKKPFISRRIGISLTGQTENSSVPSVSMPEKTKPAERNRTSGNMGHAFGDMPTNETLRPIGHGKIDLTVRWTMKEPDGLYLQSRYGILRISPIRSDIIRVTFAKEGKILDKIHPLIAVSKTEKAWMYKENTSAVELYTDELCLQVDKNGGAITYLTRCKKRLLSEKNRECRQIEKGTDGKIRTWLYLEWQKGETLYAAGTTDQAGMMLQTTARYISHGENAKQLPFLISDKGYGIIPAADASCLFCNIPAYGSYLYTENEAQMDYYFITGKTQNQIIDAYAFLCGKK
ncbi:MAG: DUF4968 domain-containing protein [Lachnospiraceae bacterium]|nr:DUF4968 domain-containing protein [Lachnospiraceae bacterium]